MLLFQCFAFTHVSCHLRQTGLDNLYTPYFRIGHMQVNTLDHVYGRCNSRKTKAILISTPQMAHVHSLGNLELGLAIYGTPLERINVAKLLGVHIDSNLKWEFHVSSILKVAQNSFQHFPRRRFWWVIIATLYQLMLQSWYQKTAQSLVNTLVLFSSHNRLP